MEDDDKASRDQSPERFSEEDLTNLITRTCQTFSSIDASEYAPTAELFLEEWSAKVVLHQVVIFAAGMARAGPGCEGLRAFAAAAVAKATAAGVDVDQLESEVESLGVDTAGAQETLEEKDQRAADREDSESQDGDDEEEEEAASDEDEGDASRKAKRHLINARRIPALRGTREAQRARHEKFESERAAEEAAAGRDYGPSDATPKAAAKEKKSNASSTSKLPAPEDYARWSTRLIAKKIDSPASTPEPPQGKREAGKRGAPGDGTSQAKRVAEKLDRSGQPIDNGRRSNTSTRESSTASGASGAPPAKRPAGNRDSSGVPKGKERRSGNKGANSGSRVESTTTRGSDMDLDQAGPSSRRPSNVLDVTTDPSTYAIDARTRAEVERTRSARLARCRSGTTNLVFAETDYYTNNPKSLLHDFAADIGKSLDQIFAQNDQLWNALPKLKHQMLLDPRKYPKKDFDEIKNQKAMSDDLDYTSLLYLLTFLKRNRTDFPLRKMRKVCPVLKSNVTSERAINHLPANALVFRISSTSPHYLSFNGAVIPIIGGLRVAMLALMAASHLFDVEFDKEVRDANVFFWVCAKLSLKCVTVSENVRKAHNIVTGSD